METPVSIAEIDFESLQRELPQKVALLKRGLNSFHEALADYILLNPGATLLQKGAYFGYTPSWISTVENTDMFKTYFAERRKGVAVAVLHDLPSKLAAAANLATERMMEVLEKTQDSATVIDAFDSILAKHGYTGKPQGPSTQTNNVFFLSSSDLAQAQKVLVQSHEKAVEGEVLPALSAPT